MSLRIFVRSLVVRVLSLAPLVSACTPPAQAPRAVTVAAIVIDQSLSAGSAERRCREVRARAEQLMADPPFEFVVLGTGSEKSGNEPTVLVNRRRWKSASRALFKDPKAQKTERENWVDQIEAECKGSFVASDRSPILRSVERALESLRAREVEMTREEKPYRLRLFIHSDMSEGVDPAFRARLTKRRRRKLPALPSMKIDQIDVQVCLGEHLRDGNRDLNQIHALWRAVFTEKVLFGVACPMPKPVEAGAR